MIFLSLILSLATTASPISSSTAPLPELVFEVPELGIAPQLPEFPKNVAPPIRGGQNGYFVALPKGSRERNGTWLPYPRDRLTGASMRLLMLYPEACQKAIDRQTKVLDQQMVGDAGVFNALLDDSAAVLAYERAEAWKTWEVVGVAVGSLAVGILVERIIP